jgi:hypothetical protein
MRRKIFFGRFQYWERITITENKKLYAMRHIVMC